MPRAIRPRTDTGGHAATRPLMAFVAWCVTACSPSSDEGRTQPTPPATPELAIARSVLDEADVLTFADADAQRGARVVLGQTRCRADTDCFACYTCHGVRGEGSSLARFPRLAGQPYLYLYRSLLDYARGARLDPTMHEVAARLTEQQMRDSAAYYATAGGDPPGIRLQRTVAPQERALLELGRRIATTGIAESGVPACTSCHGPPVTAMPDYYPFLEGQPAEYAARQLRAFRDGRRRGPLRVMEPIARALDEQQIQAVSRYYASLEPPAPRQRPDSPAPSTAEELFEPEPPRR